MAVLLQVNELHKSYGAVTILDAATASFGDDQKIGVIGRNGAGKSTLCRIITGHEAADSGSIEDRITACEQAIHREQALRIARRGAWPAPAGVATGSRNAALP